MTIHEQIYSALSVLVDGRVFPEVAPEGTPTPRIIYQRVGGQRNNTFDGPSALRNARIQIDVWADNRKAAADLAERAEMVCAEALRAISLGEPVDSYEPDTKLYRSNFDISVWYK